MIDKFENNRNMRKFIAQVENKTCFNWNENIVDSICFEIYDNDTAFLMKQAQKLGSNINKQSQYIMKQKYSTGINRIQLIFDLNNDWKQLYKDIKNNLRGKK